MDRIRIQHTPIRPFQPAKPEVVARLREQLGIAGETRVLLSVGRLSSEKGHENLIRAFRDLLQLNRGISVRLVLVGEGPERRCFIRLCEQFEISGDVTLVGHQDDVRPYYAIADLYIAQLHPFSAKRYPSKCLC